MIDVRLPALLGLLFLAGFAAVPAKAKDVEPRMTLVLPKGEVRPVVALTFDACSGATDTRILDTLVSHSIPATIFATHRWLTRNPAAVAVLKAHPDLFEIENHGDRHIPAITDIQVVFGLATAGTLAAVRAEVDGGAAAVTAATGIAPRWFRGATARYSPDALALIKSEGYAVAGYSLNADIGASLPAQAVAHRLEAARSGDVVIAHINQPTHPAGAGIVEGLLALQRAGTRFVRLDEVQTSADVRGF